jgi:hypothetical protein
MSRRLVANTSDFADNPGVGLLMITSAFVVTNPTDESNSSRLCRHLEAVRGLTTQAHRVYGLG